jgi:glycosyltransferase involved in cell wall biosynthesis
MKISVVTISFNQGDYLEKTIQSVLNQKNADFEYIIVDPGSTDGSRDIIEKYRRHFSAVILEPDQGPRDGLNKGFKKATGEIFFYLNSDDLVEPGAFAVAAAEFARDPDLDIVCGHCWMIDSTGRRLRRTWSDPWHPVSQAYCTSIQVQPSTYFRASAFRGVNGFNDNHQLHLGWDGELFIDMCLAGAHVKVIDAFLSSFRLHRAGLTGGGYNERQWEIWQKQQFRKIMHREFSRRDKYIWYLWFARRQFRNPRALFERLIKGPIYKRYA